MKKHNRQRGFSLIELLVVVAIILIIAAIAIPNLLKAKQSAQQANAVSALRTINTAEQQYQLTYNSFSPTLDAMIPPATGSPASATAADLLPKTFDDVASAPIMQQFTITYAVGTADVNGNYNSYTITAVPLSTASPTIITSYFTDQSNVIRYSNVSATPATVASTVLGN